MSCASTPPQKVPESETQAQEQMPIQIETPVPEETQKAQDNAIEPAPSSSIQQDGESDQSKKQSAHTALPQDTQPRQFPELLPENSTIRNEPALQFFPYKKSAPDKTSQSHIPTSGEIEATKENGQKLPEQGDIPEALADETVPQTTSEHDSLAGEIWDTPHSTEQTEQTNNNTYTVPVPDIPLSSILQVYEEPAQKTTDTTILPYVYEPSPAIKTNEPKQVSRSVTITRDQYLDLSYPGQGWVFLGDATGLLGVSYYGRKLSDTGTVFTLRGVEPGTYVLHFAKQDMLTDTYIDDYVQVIVLDTKSSGDERKTAPPYVVPEVAPPTQSAQVTPPDVSSSVQSGEQTPITPAPAYVQTNESSPSRTQPASVIQNEPELQIARVPQSQAPATVNSTAQTTAPVTQTMQASTTTAAQLLSDAEKALAEGKPAQALQLLDEFFRKAVQDLDKGWFVRGQAYEANGESKNIKAAFDAYRTLTEAYPASPFWQQAKDRMNYINRFYFSIF